MAVTIVATVGSASANSFVTLAEWTTYMEARLNSSAFDDATTDNQNRALVEATRDLDVLPWRGVRAADTQALSMPRDYLPDPDATLSDPALDYPYYADDVIPERVKDATFELALEYLRAGTTDIAKPDASQDLIRRRVDVIEQEWAEPYQRATGIARYPRVMGRIAPLLDGSRMGGFEMVRV